MDQLDAMRVFVAVARGGSLSSAARSLGVPLASVSRKLAALERHVNARLLSRTTRRMALTDSGLRYLDACRRVLADLAEADCSLAGAEADLAGTLTVTAPVVFGRLRVLPIAVEFLRLHPRMDVRLTLDDRNVDLVEAGIDVAVRIGTLADSAVVVSRVGSIRRITCASAEYLRTRGTPQHPEDLAAHDCITFTGVASPERWPFAGRRGLRGVEVRSRLTVTTAEAAIDAAAAGLGVTRVLAYQAAAALADGRLTPVLEAFEPAPLPVSVLHGEGRAARPRVRTFVELATTQLRRSLRP